MPNARHARITDAELARFGELSKTEIRILLYLKLCRNGRTGRCDPSRATIAAGTGLQHRSHVTEGIAGLEQKGWIIEDESDGFLFPNPEQISPPIVPESGTKKTVPESGTFPNPEQSVPDSARFVPESGTRRNNDSLNKQNNKGTNKPCRVKRDGGDIEKVFAYYKFTFGKTDRFTLTKKRRKAIAERLKSKSVGDIFDAIRGCKVSPHHSGDNPTGTVYDDIELICRSDDHTERFIEIYERRQKFVGRSRAGETFAADPNAGEGVADGEDWQAPEVERRPAPTLPPKVAAFWIATKDRLSKQFNRDVFRTWFEPVICDGLDEGERRLLLRSGRVTYDWINLYYSDALAEAIAAAGLDGFTIKWEIEDATEYGPRTATAG